MLRTLALLLAFFALAVFLAQLPPPAPATTSGEARLYDVEFHLFPAADPDAEWTLRAKEVDYDPKTKSARIRGQVEGVRRVKGELDLRLRAGAVVIDAWDNLRMPRATIQLPKECWTMELEDGVRIDQRRGYRAGRFRLEGPGLVVEGFGFSADFALKNARWERGKEEWNSDAATDCNQS